MDALVKAALEKLNSSIKAIDEIKPENYPTAEMQRKIRRGSGVTDKERFEIQSKLDNMPDESYEEALSRTIAKAIKTIDALRSALKIIEPEENDSLRL